ncbi:hypothetical protein L873DRAFT_1800931 [Choiromyces venosus 120613-1]|uniref:Uncharacterized protein n=1 Tax=Choiromyces venosus 120613-1 TaxID=1336337 RepID=A0A3N4KBK9_9PEZI|nr:hypothetical protein L873DRAFT_1800931 [Choiromyces venosus 120613-1]
MSANKQKADLTSMGLSQLFCLLTLIYHKQSLKHLLQYPTGFLPNPESSSINKGKTYISNRAPGYPIHVRNL